MKDAGPAPAWTNKFKRQIVLIGMIGISPSVLFLARASDVPRSVLVSFQFVCVVALGFGAWYLFGSGARPSNEKMTDREWWIAVSALVAVLTLIAFNAYKIYF